ncbi:MAG TPA: class I fructose-bisphosphate aldolase [Gaiella sp.]|jgi:fructose-bisphosphate aldolase class I|nr:class I fructose-bisphosphate aldolase [Gaiella sp.]
MAAKELKAIAESIVADHKGVLAADESTGTIKKRFDSIGVDSTEESRRAYRNLLFTTPGFEEYVGGVIMYDETLRQASDDGTPFGDLLASKGVVPGIKVDTGAQDLAGHPGEKVTEGLDGLRARFEEYHALGARFSKWRAVITIGDGIPTDACIHTNAHALARYAALSQEAGIVPIVEPEVLMDADNTIERCYEVTARTLHVVFYELYRQEVALEGMLLKPNMVISGKQCATQAPSSQIAELTVDCFLRHVPAIVPGIVFLSGGQSEVEATENLNSINRVGGPWPLSFSYGRALQASALEAWRGDSENVEAGQEAFLHRARMNALAVAGNWSADVEEAVPA